MVQYAKVWFKMQIV